MSLHGNDVVPTSTKHLFIAGYNVHLARFGQDACATRTIDTDLFEAPSDLALCRPMSEREHAGKDMLESILLSLYSQSEETLDNPAVLESFETAITSFVENYDPDHEDNEEVCECGRPPHLCTFRDTSNHEDA